MHKVDYSLGPAKGFNPEPRDFRVAPERCHRADPLTKGFYSTFFVVPKKDRSCCLILNLRPLNRFIRYRKFKMETNMSVLGYLTQGDWLASLDLKDAYLHIPFLPAHRPYQRFAFQGTIYQFKVLPFGLTSALRVFTMVLNPIAEILHKKGVMFIPYLDDILLVAKSREVLISPFEFFRRRASS